MSSRLAKRFNSPSSISDYSAHVLGDRMRIAFDVEASSRNREVPTFVL
jgi:hypothetical protein